MPSFPLDIRTIINLVCVGNLAALGLFSAYRTGAGTERPYRIFMASKGLQAAAWLLLGQRGQIPDSLSAYLGNVLLLGGFACEALALISLRGSRRRLCFAVAGVAALGILASCSSRTRRP